MGDVSFEEFEEIEKAKENIDKSKKYRNWFMTLNNWTQQTHDILLCLKNCEYLFQHEVGKKGTPHIQGILVFKNARNWEQMRKSIGNYYFRNAKNVNACWNYCKKVQTRVSDGYFTNIPRFMAKKPFKYEFHWWQKVVNNYLEAPAKWDDRDEILWIWSRMGRQGKTVFLKWLILNNWI